MRRDPSPDLATRNSPEPGAGEVRFGLFARIPLFAALTLLAWQCARGLWLTVGTAIDQPQGARVFALAAGEEERFATLGVAGRAAVLVRSGVPRRADLYALTGPDLVNIKLHVDLVHLLYPRSVHHMTALPEDPLLLAHHLRRGAWILDVDSGHAFDWERIARLEYEDGGIRLWRIPSEGGR